MAKSRHYLKASTKNRIKKVGVISSRRPTWPASTVNGIKSYIYGSKHSPPANELTTVLNIFLLLKDTAKLRTGTRLSCWLNLQVVLQPAWNQACAAPWIDSLQTHLRPNKEMRP